MTSVELVILIVNNPSLVEYYYGRLVKNGVVRLRSKLWDEVGGRIDSPTPTVSGGSPSATA